MVSLAVCTYRMAKPAAKDPKIDLSICLLREGTTFESALTDSSKSDSHDVRVGQIDCRLFVNNGYLRLPGWTKTLGEIVNLDVFKKARSVSAVLLVPSSGRLFAVTFGYGRTLLDPRWLEDRFGLKVVLNTIDASHVKSVDKRSLDALGRQARVQTSKAANVREFGIDVEQDLLTAVTGTPTNSEKFGTRITGADSLRVTYASKFSKLPGILKNLYDSSQAKGYLKEFPWVDQLREVSKNQIDGLNQRLLEKLSRDNRDIRLAVPTILDWGEIAGFQYNGIGDDLERDELELSDVDECLRAEGLTWSSVFDSARVTAVDDRGTPVQTWALRRCMFGEIADKNSTFVLSGGQWYEVQSDFVTRVNEDVEKIPDFETLPQYNDKDEAGYCNRIAREVEEWTHFDRNLIQYGGGRSQVEFCDLYRAADTTLLHIKRYSGSAPLSHLFAQGLVSGEAFRGDESFRVSVNEKLPRERRLANLAKAPEGCNIVFGIVKADKLQLPFFAKVALRQTAKRLTNLTFNVRKAHIGVDATAAATRRARQRARKH